MFRAAIRKLSLRQKLMLLVSVGMLLPILILTYMQYRSLAELQSKTKGAFKDNLRQGLPIVEHQMKQRLEDIAAQTLNPIGSMHLSSAEEYFAGVKRSHPEIEEIFAFDYSGDRQKATAYVYSNKFEKVAQAGFTPAQSHTLSLFEKSRIAQSFLDGNRKYLFVHDSPGAYLFYPLTAPTGFAGVFLNERFVSDDLIAFPAHWDPKLRIPRGQVVAAASIVSPKY